MNQPSILIVDDNPAMQKGVRVALEGAGYAVREADDGRTARRLLAQRLLELALRELRLPDADDRAATRAVKGLDPRISAPLVTAHDDMEYLLEALETGAAGRLLTGSNRGQLLAAVWDVLRGEQVLPPGLAGSRASQLAEENRRELAFLPPKLTERELEVLAWLTSGKTNREIAQELTVSAATVKRHMENIIRKMGVADRTQAAVRAVQLGLAEPAGRSGYAAARPARRATR